MGAMAPSAGQGDLLQHVWLGERYGGTWEPECAPLPLPPPQPFYESA